MNSIEEPSGETAMTPVNRYVGPTLVNATFQELTNCVNLGAYPVLKVVPTDSWGLLNSQRQHEFWNDNNRLNVCNLTRWTIVRTLTGDGGQIDPSRVAAELRPWYAAKKRSRWGVNPQPGYSNLLIELGNEPNMHDRYQDDQFIWETRWNLLRAIDVCRQLDREFGVTSKLICTSLAPRFYWSAEDGENLRRFIGRWLQIFATTNPQDGRNAVDECNFVAVHFYAKRSWTDESGDNDNSMRFMIDTYNRWVGNRRWWILTEFGLRNGSSQAALCDDYTKGHRNAGMLHFNEGPGSGTSHRPLPGYVWGGTYFQLNTLANHSSTDTEGGYAYYYPNGDWSYRNRVNSGLLRGEQATAAEPEQAEAV